MPFFPLVKIKLNTHSVFLCMATFDGRATTTIHYVANISITHSRSSDANHTVHTDFDLTTALIVNLTVSDKYTRNNSKEQWV